MAAHKTEPPVKVHQKQHGVNTDLAKFKAPIAKATTSGVHPEASEPAHVNSLLPLAGAAATAVQCAPLTTCGTYSRGNMRAAGLGMLTQK